MNEVHCCEQMNMKISMNCSEHDKFSCPDTPIYYDEVFDEYGLIVFDGGESYILMEFCPWCGKKLPEPQRDRWFVELEALGYDEPMEQKIPDSFKSSKWRKQS